MAISDSLHATTLAIAAPAVHYVIQWIRQWAAANQRAFVVDDKTIPPEAMNIAKTIVTEIEAAEGVSAADLPVEKVQQYIEILSDSLEQLASEQLHTNDHRGKAILERLRSG